MTALHVPLVSVPLILEAVENRPHFIIDEEF